MRLDSRGVLMMGDTTMGIAEKMIVLSLLLLAATALDALT